MRYRLAVLRGADQYIFTLFIRLQGIDGDGKHVGCGVILNFDDSDLVGPDAIAVRNTDGYQEGAAAGVDRLPGDMHDTHDLPVVQSGKGDLYGSAYLHAFLVNF